MYPIRLACNTMSLACGRKQENPGRTHTDTRPPGRSDRLVENKWSLCSILCVEWKSTGGNEPLRETGAAFFFVVLINWSMSACARCPLTDWKSGSGVTDRGIICSNNYTHPPHTLHPTDGSEDAGGRAWKCPASMCVVRFRKSDFVPCRLLETSDIQVWAPAAGQSVQPQSSNVLCSDVQVPKATADLRDKAKQHLLITNERPSFSESLPTFTCILIYQ